MAASEFQRWKCTVCGKSIEKSKKSGRPEPGNCPRKPKDVNGKYKPHSWVKN